MVMILQYIFSILLPSGPIMLLLMWLGYSNTQPRYNSPPSITVSVDTIQRADDTAYTREILCDTIYPLKGYKLVYYHFSDETSYDTGVYNTTITFLQFRNGAYKEFYKDSLQCFFEEIRFEDFNGDKVKDLLVENISDVRSNLTYYLYLIDTVQNTVKKIKDFEQIKNPQYLEKYDLIDNQVMSGRNWTGFYKIREDRAVDLGYTVHWTPDEHGLPKDPDKEYQRILSEILRKEKRNKK